MILRENAQGSNVNVDHEDVPLSLDLAPSSPSPPTSVGPRQLVSTPAANIAPPINSATNPLPEKAGVIEQGETNESTGNVRVSLLYCFMYDI